MDDLNIRISGKVAKIEDMLKSLDSSIDPELKTERMIKIILNTEVGTTGDYDKIKEAANKETNPLSITNLNPNVKQNKNQIGMITLAEEGAEKIEWDKFDEDSFTDFKQFVDGEINKFYWKNLNKKNRVHLGAVGNEVKCKKPKKSMFKSLFSRKKNPYKNEEKAISKAKKDSNKAILTLENIIDSKKSNVTKMIKKTISEADKAKKTLDTVVESIVSNSNKNIRTSVKDVDKAKQTLDAVINSLISSVNKNIDSASSDVNEATKTLKNVLESLTSSTNKNIVKATNDVNNANKALNDIVNFKISNSNKDIVNATNEVQSATSTLKNLIDSLVKKVNTSVETAIKDIGTANTTIDDIIKPNESSSESSLRTAVKDVKVASDTLKNLIDSLVKKTNTTVDTAIKGVVNATNAISEIEKYFFNQLKKKRLELIDEFIKFLKPTLKEEEGKELLGCIGFISPTKVDSIIEQGEDPERE